jgi:hypothetical protein
MFAPGGSGYESLRAQKVLSKYCASTKFIAFSKPEGLVLAANNLECIGNSKLLNRDTQKMFLHGKLKGKLSIHG